MKTIRLDFVRVHIIYCMMFLSIAAYSDTFTVSNLDDSGIGSLRWAIEQANAATGPDLIDFNVSGIIFPLTALPHITDDGTVIDASSQWDGTWPGGAPGVILDGSNIDTQVGESTGLVISGAINCHIRGLSVTQFVHSGIIIINSSQFNVVGGAEDKFRNVVSGNGGGIQMQGPGVNNNTVIGNYVGTASDGSAINGNSVGIMIDDGSKYNVIGGSSDSERNIVSGNHYGIRIEDDGTDENEVIGNLIGTDFSGTVGLGGLDNEGNQSGGVMIGKGAKNNTIGGLTAGKRNLISGNWQGVLVSDNGTTGNIVIGNYIGTEITGTAALGNKHAGVSVGGGAQNNTIGGSTTSARNVISGNGNSGIEVVHSGTNGNIISGNFIGVDATGNSGLGNAGSGISVREQAQFNTIGGSVTGAGNVISANNGGIWLGGTGTDNNIITGNFVGTNASGIAGIGNTEHDSGIKICDGAKNNRIGGIGQHERNIISGNHYGLELSNSGTENNTVIGNLIGPDVTGTIALNGLDPSGNQAAGLMIDWGAANNTIGGTGPGERNIISGNGNGIEIGGSNTMNNRIIGNVIGLSISGTPLGNVATGIGIWDYANSNDVGGANPGEGNIISGNSGSGIQLSGHAHDNVVQGNFIGTDAGGTLNLGNHGNGIFVVESARSNIIGGTGAGEPNIIAYSGGRGIEIREQDTDFNRISGNSIHDNAYLGIDLVDGGNDEIPAPVITFYQPNGNSLSVEGNGAGAGATVELFEADYPAFSAEGKTYLGSLTADGSGNFSGSVDVTGKGYTEGDPVVATTTHTNNNTSEFSIQRLRLTVDNPGDTDDGATYTHGDGTNTLRKCIRLANEFSGPDTIDFNISGVISPSSCLPWITDDETVIDAGSQWNGTWPGGEPGITLDGTAGGAEGCFIISGANACHIRGFYITNYSYYIIDIRDGAQYNTIGGSGPGHRNVISGNSGDGIAIHGTGTDHNYVTGNFVGTDVTGSTGIGNGHSNGIFIFDGTQNNTIGGAGQYEGNVVSGNWYGIRLEGDGVDGNEVIGNLIGTDVTGTVALVGAAPAGNQADGVIIGWGAKNNIVGGSNIGEGNIISGNGSGIAITSGSNTMGNRVVGNFIGTDISGQNAIGNDWGIRIDGGAQRNTIGGINSQDKNIISGNTGYGIVLEHSGTNYNSILGNFIGTDISGNVDLGNSWCGIIIRDNAQFNTIGGTGIGEGNIIAYNGNHGIQIENQNTDFNRISGNSIHDNSDLGIDLVDGGNDEIPEPVINYYDMNGNELTVEGNGAGADATVEIFEADSPESGEGMTYLGILTADGTGQFSGPVDVTGKGYADGNPVVATTTHADNNTSEFSKIHFISTQFLLYDPQINGIGEGNPNDRNFYFELSISSTQNLDPIQTSHIKFIVDQGGQETEIPVSEIHRNVSNSNWMLAAGNISDLHLGTYKLWLTDDTGYRVSNTEIIGDLAEAPIADAAEFILPFHNQAITTLETIEWEDFKTVYLGSEYSYNGYELSLGDHSGQNWCYGSSVAGEHSLLYSIFSMETGAPDILENGSYYFHLSTSHYVTSKIVFVHNRQISFSVSDVPISIDGNKDDFWNTVSCQLHIGPSQLIWGTVDVETDCSGTLYLAYDENYLYGFFEALDNVIGSGNGDWWNNDALDFKIDLNPSSTFPVELNSWDEPNLNDMTEIQLTAAGDFNGEAGGTPNTVLARQLTGTGYILEFAIPMSEIENTHVSPPETFTLSEGLEIGALIELIDLDGQENREAQMVYGHQTAHPDYFWRNVTQLGHLQFLADHQIALSQENLVMPPDAPFLQLPRIRSVHWTNAYQGEGWGLDVSVYGSDPQGYQDIQSIRLEDPEGTLFTLYQDGDETDNTGRFPRWIDWLVTSPAVGEYTCMITDKSAHTASVPVNLTAVLDYPHNLSPPNNTIVSDSDFTISWDPVSCASWYWVAVRSADGSHTYWASSQLTGTSVSYNGDGTGEALPEGGPYQLYVQAGDEHNSSEVNGWNIYYSTTGGPNIIYVDHSNQSGIEDGSMENPFNTISEGVEAAIFFDDEIRVAEGTYNEHISIWGKSIGLFGGFRNSDWTRDPAVYETIIDGNNNGIVLFAENSNLTVDGFVIQHGVNPEYQGGGIDFRDGELTIHNCIIRENVGGVFLHQGNQQILNCQLIENTSPCSHAASALIAGNSTVLIKNTIIARNAGVYEWSYHTHITPDAEATFKNCTITGNQMEGFGGAGYKLFYNCIRWNNAMEGDLGSLHYSDCPGAPSENGNISANPLFIDGPGGDYRLCLGSPCIDSGDPDAAYNDVDGSRNDMGVYGGPDGESYTYGENPFLVIIDGNKDVYWNSVNCKLPIGPSQLIWGTVDGAADCSGTLYLAYDEQCLYGYFEATDDVIGSKNDDFWWQNDAMDFKIDLDPSTTIPLSEGGYQPNINDIVSIEFTAEDNFSASASGTASTLVARRLIDTEIQQGYIIEFAIPFSEIENNQTSPPETLTPDENLKIGILVEMIDQDEQDTREGQMVYGHPTAHTQYFWCNVTQLGHLQFQANHQVEISQTNIAMDTQNPFIQLPSFWIETEIDDNLNVFYTFNLFVFANDPQGYVDIASVFVDGPNGFHYPLYDDGDHGDNAQNDGAFGNYLTEVTTPPFSGEYIFTIQDVAGHQTSVSIEKAFNQPPVADAGPDQIVQAADAGGALVTLDGTASNDPDNDELTFVWTGPFETAEGPSPTVQLPLGSSQITLTVKDPLQLSDTDEVIIEVSGFTMAVDPASQSINPGGSTTFLVSLHSLAGFESPVQVSVTGSPQVIETVTYLPSTQVIPSGTAVVKIKTISNAPLGNYTLNVTATGGLIQYNQPVNLTITEEVPSGDLNLLAHFSEQTVIRGATTTTEIDVLSLNGFNDPVTMSVLNVPDDAVSSFSPNPVLPLDDGLTRMSVKTWTTTTPGQYLLSVRGEANTIIRETTVIYNVIDPPAGGNTPVNESRITIPVGNSISTSFASVKTEGNTSAVITSEAPELPGGFELAGDYYEISTTAEYTSPVRICIRYPDSPLEGSYRLFHYEEDGNGGTWVDVTCYGYPDTEANVICGTVPSFSLFAIGKSEPPVIAEIVPQSNPVPANFEYHVTATFIDPDPNGSHTAVWTWGDGNTSDGSIDKEDGTVTGTHIYQATGVYTITLVVTDENGNFCEKCFYYSVIFDPNAGFVTGGGWINSPPGAYTWDPTLTGKANFGFNAKYKKGKSVPEGNTQFHFNVADFKFNSTSYEWLVIAGPHAKFKGSGTINGDGDYGFMLTATDADVNGGGDVDKFRIKIWQKDDETVIYDNQMGDADDADATDAIEGGSIVIHNDKLGKWDPETGQIIPEKFALRQNFPNPFNPSTTIPFDLPEKRSVILKIYNIYGQEVCVLGNKEYQPGFHEIVWDGLDARGIQISSGIYIYRIQAGEFTGMKKMMLIR
jgi:hypothetical protein